MRGRFAPRPVRRERSVLAALLIAGVACTTPTQEPPGGAAAPLPQLRVEGNRIVDESGATVVLRGVSFSDPDRLERAGQWNRALFQAAKDWNANVVRLPVHPSSWRNRGEDSYLRLLDQGVEWAEELGMYVIIDWHSIGSLTAERFTRDIYETTRVETLHFWQTIAGRYADRPVVAFHELFNEPTTNSDEFGTASWPEHKALMEEMIALIRAHDGKAIPLVAGFDWGYDLTPVRDDPIDAVGVAYVAHPYPQKRPRPWEARWEEDWGFVAATYPVFVTEFGFMSADDRGAHIPVIGDESYGEAIIAYLEERGISWTAWVFDPDWSPQLIQGWTFEPTRQGVFFRSKLRELNPRG
jgi:endoglucanase